jgi:hypothetical protein
MEPNYDDPAVEELWCAARKTQVIEYLAREGVTHGRVGDWPAWHVTPYVSVWAIESASRTGWVGWWVLCGDLPTDYESADKVKNPRDATRAIALRWQVAATQMARGERDPNFSVGDPEYALELAPLLKSRVQTLLSWVEDEALWIDRS